MFAELARTHQAFAQLLNHNILEQLTAYHNRFFSLGRLELPADFLSVQQKLQPRCADIEQKWDQLQKDIASEMNAIESRMADLAVEKKLTTRVHWVRRLRCNHEFYHKNRNISLEPEDLEQLKFEVIKHLPSGYCPVALLGVDHRTPSMLSQLTHYGNPLYVADIYQESLSLLDALPQLTQRRILSHCLGREDNQVGLHNIMPQKQFGCIVVWNLFNYFTEEVIKEWLEQIALLLRPGGKVFFTYNNCLDPANATFVDLTRNGFTIPSRLRVISEQVGLEICEFNSVGSAHWAVLAQPGEFHSIRSTPGIGQIMIKN